mmetsp:Transcript_35195/g.113366  ORF Transcript_35195/g.113366 Transcript_35195/m.113366 type:complete len:238 (+) Transcript_35195:723-1436(+)
MLICSISERCSGSVWLFPAAWAALASAVSSAAARMPWASSMRMLLEVAWKQCSFPLESRRGSSRTSCEKGLPDRVWWVSRSAHVHPFRMASSSLSACWRWVRGPSTSCSVSPITCDWASNSHRESHAADAKMMANGAAADVMTCTYSSAAACMQASASVSGRSSAPPPPPEPPRSVASSGAASFKWSGWSSCIWSRRPDTPERSSGRPGTGVPTALPMLCSLFLVCSVSVVSSSPGR